MATETKSTNARLNPSAQDVSSKPKFDSSTLKKKVDSTSRYPPDSKMKSVTKSEVKSRATTSSSSSSSSFKIITKTTTTKVRERKVYSLPGQKHDPPEQKEPLRVFYESLSKQIPTSQMAEFWLMEHGLLSPERAKKAFEKKQRKQKELRTGTPVKLSKPPIKAETSKKQQQGPKNADVKALAKKRIANESDDDDDDDDFILSHKRKR